MMSTYNNRRDHHDKEALACCRAKIARYIGCLDQKVSQQLSLVIHHPSFKALEGSWRNLAYIIKNARNKPNTRIRILHLNYQELSNDLLHAIDFDQSQFFEKIYNQGLGIAGGEPFSFLIGNYEFGHSLKDIQVLRAIAEVAAAAFAPFIAAAAPSLLGLDRFSDLGRQPDLTQTFTQYEYGAWQQLRQYEDMRFVALTLPHHLLRLPYHPSKAGDCFQYQDPQPEQDYLWGNAAFAFAVVVMRNFTQYGWFGNIRGAPTEIESGGYVPPATSADEPGRLAPVLSTDVLITDSQEKFLSDLGFIPLCQKSVYERAVFYSNASMLNIKAHAGDPTDMLNLRANAMLQYSLCACRFAHYLKVMVRDKIGSFTTSNECEQYLTGWLLKYVAGNGDLGPEQRARYPLQGGKIKISIHPTLPDLFQCVMHLKPFFQLEQVHAEFIFVTTLPFQSRKEHHGRSH